MLSKGRQSQFLNFYILRNKTNLNQGDVVAQLARGCGGSVVWGCGGSVG
jgi:hypothetical protein